jgi:hypothetical protein
MFIDKSQLSISVAHLWAMDTRFAPSGASNVIIGLASYKHFVPPGLFRVVN